ncbi:MAG: hypothetical protein WCR45_10180 [Bacteroidaceae bacterium]
MKAKEISSKSPKNALRCEITYNKALKDVGSVESFGAMTLEEILKEENINESNRNIMKKANDKTVTTRIPQEMWEWLIETGGTAGGAVKAILDEAERVHQQGNEVLMIADNLAILQQIRRYSLNEIKGKFSSAEWSYMADSLNGTMITPEFRCMTGALALSIEDSNGLDGLGAKWGVDVSALINKVNRLTGAQVDAVFTRISAFWNSEDKDLETWSIW